jgi:hypothetical protein
LSEQTERLGRFPLTIGWLSFIPGLSIPLGLVAIVWGLASKKRGGKKLAALGVGGIAFSVVLYFVLLHLGYIKPTEVGERRRGEPVDGALTSLVQAIEAYKGKNGAYPQDLGELRRSLPQDAMRFIVDPTDTSPKVQRYFFYELAGDHYYARSVGPDGKAYTPDDILPSAEGAGLRTDVPPDATNVQRQ